MVREIIEESANAKIKLYVSKYNSGPLDSLLDSPDRRECEEIEIRLKLNEKEIQRIRRIYEIYGKNAKKLTWSNWTEFEVSASVIVELLNLLPSLESISFSSWTKPFVGDAPENGLNLQNLKSIDVSECDNFILQFLATSLPDNTLETLKETRVRDSDANFSALIAKQKSIKNLDITGEDLKASAPLQELKLNKLRAIISKNEEKHEEQVEFLRSLIIGSQSSLTSLDLLNDSDYSCPFVDDALFAEICKLTKLETLIISVDGISQINGFENLKKLKNLILKTNRKKSLAIFRKLAGTKNETLEQLTLNLWIFEIPAETYEAFGENFKALKSLKITLGTHHKINFFAKAFPNIEELSVRFGEANHPVEFQQAFESDTGIVQSKLKSLSVRFWGSEMIDTTEFFEMLSIFPNLEKLEMSSNFPFCADFFNQLSEKLNKIKSIKLSLILIRSIKDFAPSITNSLKALAANLKFTELSFRNYGNSIASFEVDEYFSYQPFIDSLGGVYNARVSSYATFQDINDLVLTTAGTNTTDSLKALALNLKCAELGCSNIQHIDLGRDAEDQNFSFKPLIDSLDGVYKVNESEC